jgi:carbonic anhydrase
MTRPSLSSRVLAFALLAATALTVSASDREAHWAYEGRNGAQAWGDLEPGFAVCKLGRFQSPIDIRDAAAKKAPLPPIGFAYAAAPAEVVNNGHTIQVNLPAGGSVGLPDGRYKLLQFHFHAPSEETFNGQAYPMVVHLVHQSAAGRMAVVAVLLKEGRENAALAPVFDQLPARAGDKRALPTTLDLTGLLPADRAYYRFKGSLTTPPCSEDVSWQVLRQPVEISKAQLQAFRNLYPMNARPTQPLNGRAVERN